MSDRELIRAWAPLQLRLYQLACYELFYREFVYYDSRFKNTLERPRPTRDDSWDKPTFDRGRGSAGPAVWEGGNVANPSAKITAKFGSSSYEKLFSGSRRPLNLGWTTVPNVSPQWLAPGVDTGRLAAAAV